MSGEEGATLVPTMLFTPTGTVLKVRQRLLGIWGRGPKGQESNDEENYHTGN